MNKIILSLLLISCSYGLDCKTWKMMDETLKGNYLLGYSSGIISGADSALSTVKNYIRDEPSKINVDENHFIIRRFSSEMIYPFRLELKETRINVDKMYEINDNQILSVEDILELLGLRAMGLEENKIEKHRLMLLGFKKEKRD